MDLTGRTCLVTGASAGVGRAVAQNLARLGARVILACRCPRRGAAAQEAIHAATGNTQLELQLVDLAQQRSIRAFAEDVRSRHDALHVLVNNAGVYAARREVTVDGYETTWATNVLAYHLVTTLLLDLLRAGAPARIVNIASGHAGGLALDDLQFQRRRFLGGAAYRQSKQANRMLSWELARRLEGSGVTVNAATPGWVSSEITRHQRGPWGLLIRAAFGVMGRSATEGADTPTWLAASPDVEREHGVFWERRRPRRCEFRQPAEQQALWGICEAQTGDAAAATAPQERR